MARHPVLSSTDKGIYCQAGDFHIDPQRPVDRALITHGHADHARRGHGQYLATAAAAPVLRLRLGNITLDTVNYGESRRIGDASVSFHPAGHVPGSAQIRVEVAGEVWVASGDYKLVPDGLSEPFESVRCHTFITESTFGLPVFGWPSQQQVATEINSWWQKCRDDGVTPLLGAYSLGKAQRLMTLLDPSIGPILTHGAIEATTRVLRDQGYALPATISLRAGAGSGANPGGLVLAPPTTFDSPELRHRGPVSTGFASGWMQMRAMRRRRTMGRGFILSDHADWSDLNTAIRESEATTVFVTHGYSDIFARWLREIGLDARVIPPRPRDRASAQPPAQ